MEKLFKCSNCETKINHNGRYCGCCGKSIEMECSRCFIRNNTKYCINCGSQMVKAFTKNLTENEKSSPDNNQISIKVNIVKVCTLNSSFVLEDIKLERGGGPRTLTASVNDKYKQIEEKLCQLYFKNGVSEKLGSLRDYKTILLDFTKVKLRGFHDLKTYLKQNGLKPQQKPIIFLCLEKILKITNTTIYSTSSASKSTCSNSTTMINNLTLDNNANNNQISHRVSSNNPKPSSSASSPKITNQTFSSIKLTSNNSITNINKSVSSVEKVNLKNPVSNKTIANDTVKSEQLVYSPLLSSSIEKKRKRSISKSSDSSSSYSSSSGESSFKKADKLLKKTNKRLINDTVKPILSDSLVSSSSNIPTKSGDKKGLLPTPNLESTLNIVTSTNEPINSSENNKNLNKPNTSSYFSNNGHRKTNQYANSFDIKSRSNDSRNNYYNNNSHYSSNQNNSKHYSNNYNNKNNSNNRFQNQTYDRNHTNNYNHNYQSRFYDRNYYKKYDNDEKY